MEGEDVNKDSSHLFSPLSPGEVHEDGIYHTARDILIYDKDLVDSMSAIKCYQVQQPIGYALLLGSDSTPYNIQETSGGAISKDLKHMATVLRGCGWNIESPCYNASSQDVSLSSNQCNQVLGDLEKRSADFKQYSCFLFYFSGHGVSHSVILSDGELVPYKQIISRISSIPSLQYKPKIFIFDCCRGHADFEKHEDHEFTKNSNEGTFRRHIEEKYEEEKRSDGSGYPPTDAIICFSASEGMKGLMEKDWGSIFTLQLTHALLQLGSRLSLLEILTQVSGGTVRIARRIFNRIQQPVVINTLNQLLVLNERGLSEKRKDVVCRESAHTEPLETRPGANALQKGPYFPQQRNQENDVARDAVRPSVQGTSRRPFTSRQDVESRLSQLGEGVSVFIVYAPDPESPYFDSHTSSREAQISQNEHLVYGLAYDLERHGFHVITDLHLGDKQPENWLQWYTSRIGLCDFVILVCSPAFNELFSHGQRPEYRIIDRRAQLLLSYRNVMYSEIERDVQSQDGGGKFIPLMLYDHWSMEDCVPMLFQAGTVYQVLQPPTRTFNYDSEGGFEKLVCRMAGINRVELNRPPLVGVHQLGAHYLGGGDYDSRRVFEAVKKPRKGHKVIKAGPMFTSPSTGFGGAQVPLYRPSTGPGFMPSHIQQPPVPAPYPHPGPHIPPGPVIVHPQPPVPAPNPGLPPSIPSHHPGTTLPDKEPAVSVLLWLSHRLVRWKFIGRYLGLEEHEIERIEVENLGNTTEQCYQMLNTWRVQRPTKYRYQTLGEQLLKSERNKHIYPDFVKEVNEAESLSS